MSNLDAFKQHIEEGYTFKSHAVTLGTAMLNEEALEQTLVKAPLRTFNRHGLIAGATGTGKTKSIQLLAEVLSQEGVPTLLMDLKGDLSGLAARGKDHPKIQERHDKIGIPWEATGFPVELLTISEQNGVRLRATASEFGPVLLSKILGLNDTQSGVMSVLFKFCDDNGIALLDLKDLKKAIQYITTEGKEGFADEYGAVSTASTGAIIRKIVELEQQGAELFFGEPSFEVDDLMRVDDRGLGYMNILRLTDIQNRPKLFSTFMLCLLAEIYGTLPEAGDLDKPKLVIFIDEAHLVFNEASDALLSQIESIIKLIRSKAVGIFFVTQNPADIPDAVLGQLGMKVQHALRAFTAKDRKAIKLAAQNYPISDYYKTDELLTSLGIGEAAVTVLDEKGRPTPLAATLLRAPRSRMDILSAAEIKDLIAGSELVGKYIQDIDRESAYEILGEKIKAAQEMAEKEEASKAASKSTSSSSSSRSSAKEESMMESLSKNTMVRQLGRTLMKELSRGLLGAFKKR